MGDSLQFVNVDFNPTNGSTTDIPTTASPTTAPITAVPTPVSTDTPTSDPTHEPTDEPTSDPTVEPTLVPTYGPTSIPSSNPTVSPTKPCDMLWVVLTDFDSLSADSVAGNTTIQQFLANITHSAIAYSALLSNIDSDSFYVDFKNVSGGLSIEYTLCADNVETLYTLGLVIQDDEEAIGLQISKRLQLFWNSTEIPNATISFDEFSYLL